MRIAGWCLGVVGLIGCSGPSLQPAAPPEPPVPASSAAPAVTPAATSPAATTSPPTAAAVELPCRKKASQVQGAEGSSRLVRCPAGCAAEPGTLWGTDFYTDDSAVCPALVHAGVMPASGGVASITFVRGLRAYVGSERNGVRSQQYGAWSRSFYGQALGTSGQPSTPAPQLPDENTVLVGCTHRGSLVGRKPGDALTLVCPAGCASQHYSVWGSNPYTSDSHACAAAIHAGVIPPEGGKVRVTVGDGLPSYAASSQHGIDAQRYGSYGSSFSVTAP